MFSHGIFYTLNRCRKKQIRQGEDTPRLLTGNVTAEEQRAIDQLFSDSNPGEFRIELQPSLAHCESPVLGTIFGYLLLSANSPPLLSSIFSLTGALWHSATAPATCTAPSWGAYAAEVPTSQCQMPRCTVEDLLASSNTEILIVQTQITDWPPEKDLIIFDRLGVTGDTREVPFDIVKANADFFVLCNTNRMKDVEQANGLFQKISSEIPKNDDRFNYLFYQLYIEAVNTNIIAASINNDIESLVKVKKCWR